MKYCIEVTRRAPFGNELFFPICDTAKGFAKMLKQMHLTRPNIESLKAIGFEIKNVTPGAEEKL